MDTSKDFTLAPGDLVAEFEVVRPIGFGGMGQVYEARDTKLDRRIALKLIHDEHLGNPKAIERFFVEAKALARINHPNIVAVHSFGDNEGRPYIAMEYIEGRPLNEILAQVVLPYVEAVKIFKGLLEGLSRLHQQSIIHRDIKPHNIILAKDMTPKYVDFGIAKFVDRDEGITQTSSIIGTPMWVAPELVYGGKATQQSDIWALGAILFSMVVGRHPFENNNEQFEGLDGDNLKVSFPNEVAKNLQKPFQNVILKMLEVNPQDRFSSCEQIQQSFANGFLQLRSSNMPVGTLHRPIFDFEKLKDYLKKDNSGISPYKLKTIFFNTVCSVQKKELYHEQRSIITGTLEVKLEPIVINISQLNKEKSKVIAAMSSSSIEHNVPTKPQEPQAANFHKTGQVNYGRGKKKHDYVTSFSWDSVLSMLRVLFSVGKYAVLALLVYLIIGKYNYGDITIQYAPLNQLLDKVGLVKLDKNDAKELRETFETAHKKVLPEEMQEFVPINDGGLKGVGESPRMTSTSLFKEVTYDKDNQVIFKSMPILRWYPSVQTEYYHLQLSAKRDFSFDLRQTTVNSSAVKWTKPKSGEYFWRVRARKSNGEWSPYSEVGKLTIMLPAPRLTELKIRKKATPGGAQHITLSWPKVTGAKGYKVELVSVQPKRTVFKKIVKNNGIGIKEMKAGNYLLKVAAVNSEREVISAVADRLVFYSGLAEVETNRDRTPAQK